MGTITVAGTRLHVEDTGAGGPPAVLLHGFLFDGRQFDRQVSALSPQYRCITIDFPGQGRSGPSAVGYRTDALAGLMTEALDQLGLGPVHLVGLSMGGFTAMRIAARRPDLVASLALLNTSAGAHARSKFPKQLALAAIARAFGTSLPPIVAGIDSEMFGERFRSDPSARQEREAWRSRWARSDRAALVATLLGFMGRSDFRSELPALRIPTLLIAGGADASLPPAESVAMYERIPGSRLVVLRHAGHSTPIEDPTGVTAALRDFWDGLATA